VLGVDGTLAGAVEPDSPARGAARAKTGTFLWNNALSGGYLLNAKSLAGYLTAARGRKLVFAAFIGGTHLARSSEASREGRTFGRLCEILHAAGD